MATVRVDTDQHTADEIADLDARAYRATPDRRVQQEHVVQWLRTWGTREYRPWPGR